MIEVEIATLTATISWRPPNKPARVRISQKTVEDIYSCRLAVGLLKFDEYAQVLKRMQRAHAYTIFHRDEKRAPVFRRSRV